MRRGINLGCGKVILPCPQPKHHQLIPADIYTDAGITWDNADWNELPGVNKVVDLFDYPWQGLDDNTYDVAIAAHIVEHIPHHIVWNGQFVHRHPDYQDGWFAWFGQLWRKMKHGGEVYVLLPFAYSTAAFSDPTHTRYVTMATFNYFNTPTNDSPFEYRMAQHWVYRPEDVYVMFHELALKEVGRIKNGLSPWQKFDDLEYLQEKSNREFNTITEFVVKLTAIKEFSVS